MWEFVKQVETVISFFVRVPVLSEQITVVSPRVSTEGSFLLTDNSFSLCNTLRISSITLRMFLLAICIKVQIVFYRKSV